MESGWDFADFPIEDLYNIAAAIEQGGFDFYARIIENSRNKKAKNEIRFLRDEEARHKDFFLEVLKARGRSPKAVVNPGLQSFLENEFLEPMDHLFTSTDREDTDKILIFGLVLEQKTIDFYTALKGIRSSEGEIADLERIISEEESHKRKLEMIRAY